ncbi:hypothetical protein J3458_001199 [Metarhizium acridum]|uniref:uncharacterized protein n=1 Tax=Metarhizium acridum TaxID=92637 RepID=UPI001C6BCAD6|nr:hypothetical protein J3458_001199 [Metarhizium acridum]
MSAPILISSQVGTTEAPSPISHIELKNTGLVASMRAPPCLFLFVFTVLLSTIKMDMRLLELRDKYLQKGLFDDPRFTNSVVKEQIHDNHWTLRRSYRVLGRITEEHFDIRLFDEDCIPHVRCSLRLIRRGHEAPQEDTRLKLSKPGIWIGPELPQHPQEIDNCTPEVSSYNSSASSIAMRSIRTTPAQISTTQESIKHKGSTAKFESVEYRVLAAAKAFRKGCQMLLVRKPQGRPLETLETIRRCFNKAEEGAILMDFWRQLKEEDTPTSELRPKTSSHIESVWRNVSTIEHVAVYMADLTDNYSPNETGNPAPTVQAERRWHRRAHALEKTRKVVSRLAECCDTAVTIFTFLEGKLSDSAVLY